MSAPLHVVRAGNGPLVVLVHGSATDHSTWTIQLANAGLKDRVRLVAYDRRIGPSIEEHAADLAALLDAEASGGERALVVGSSCGGVVVLELARRGHPRLAGMMMMEPPLPPSDEAAAYVQMQDALLVELDRLAREAGDGAAAELFLRTVLGDHAWGRLPKRFQERSKTFWPQIRGDCHALAAYRVRYPELGRIDTPARLLGGDRSAAYFRPTLEALQAALANARLDVLAGAGHMMQAEASRGFHERLLAFATELGLLP
jgi:pimeloyl-ACP methyl ester carboxylesterase